MPKKKSVKSLKQCCLRRLSLSFDKYWMTEYDTYFRELPRLLYVIGPFDNFTNEMIQNLIDSLIENKCLKRCHFEFILQDRVTSLDLSKGGVAANNDGLIKTVIVRCPKLKSLNLKGLNSVSAQVLSNMVTQLPGLQILNLCQTKCNDQVLSVIGHTSSSLIDLDISNTRTTNSGAFSLCQATSPDTGCKHLIKLQISGTQITMKGALHCLQNLSKLQYFGYDDLCGIIEMDVKGDSDFMRQYPLCNLISQGIRLQPEVTSDFLSVACLNCPNTTEAKLYSGVQDLNISSLKHLKKVRSLGLGNSEGLSLTFEHGVRPLLEEIGHQLLELTLADVNDFDLASIGQNCRNLKSLSILISGQDDSIYPNAELIPISDKRILFEKLEHIYICYPLEEISFQKSAFTILMKNAKDLKSVVLQYMQLLTSDLLLDILSSNPLRKLEKLKFVACDSVGPDFIDVLLRGDNNLQELMLHHCRNISLQDYDKHKRFVASHNWDLSISWM